jgi:hypothetical protein
MINISVLLRKSPVAGASGWQAAPARVCAEFTPTRDAGTDQNLVRLAPEGGALSAPIVGIRRSWATAACSSRSSERAARSAQNVTPDGQRILFIKGGIALDAPAHELYVVINWIEEVKQKLAAAEAARK